MISEVIGEGALAMEEMCKQLDKLQAQQGQKGMEEFYSRISQEDAEIIKAAHGFWRLFNNQRHYETVKNSLMRQIWEEMTR